MSDNIAAVAAEFPDLSEMTFDDDGAPTFDAAADAAARSKALADVIGKIRDAVAAEPDVYGEGLASMLGAATRMAEELAAKLNAAK